MKKKYFKVATILTIGLLSAAMNAQQAPKVKKFGKPIETVRCATVEYEALLQRKEANRPTEQQFENWIAQKITAQRTQRTAQNINDVVTIPVVVHVIHNGDAIGTNENITAAQIQSQITVLNQDYSRQENTPGFNNNPVGANTDISFCLAQRDPQGLASTGITRHSIGSDRPWQMEELELIKAQTQWDPEKYLNIWVVNQILVNNVAELAGYAQFPVSSGLEGLNAGTPTTANTDGVAIGYKYFGSQLLYPQGTYDASRNMGRTASHEVGHFLGLRHIWGDADNCIADDYCADTPIARTANYGCPETGYDSCPTRPGADMTANYMDYTNDVCQNIFTLNQKERMTAVLANSPRRQSLTTANSCTPGLVYSNDGSLNIQSINNNCGNTFSPVVTLTNTGTTTITQAVLSYYTGSDAPANYTWTGTLAQGEETNITLPEYSAASGQHTLNVAIATVNGVADEASSNDSKNQSFTIMPSFNTQQVVVTIGTDDYGDEIIWGLTDSNNNYVYINVDLTDLGNAEFYDDNEVYTQTIDVDPNQCYTFTILDIGGDGICCEYGDGYYTIKTAEDVLIASGGAFTITESVTFNVNGTMGTNSPALALKDIKLYPNPSHSIINIATPQATTLPESYTVYNSLGQIINNGKINSNNQELNISDYANGVYFIKLSAAGTTQTLQFIKY